MSAWIVMMLGEVGEATSLLRRGAAILQDVDPHHRSVGTTQRLLATAEWLETDKLTPAIHRRFQRCRIHPSWGIRELACCDLGIALAFEGEPAGAVAVIDEGLQALPPEQPLRQARLMAARAFASGEDHHIDAALRSHAMVGESHFLIDALLASSLLRAQHPRATVFMDQARGFAERQMMAPDALVFRLLAFKQPLSR